MKLSKESRYAVEGLMVLAKKRFGAPIQLRDVATAAGVPASFLAKIFQKLSKARILTASHGTVRGYALAHHPKNIKMADVFTAVEGSDIFDRCIFWSDRCADRSPCPMHFAWIPMRQAMVELMQQTTLADLARKRRTHNVHRSRRFPGGISQ